MDEKSQKPQKVEGTPRRTSFMERLVTGGGTPSVMGERLAKEVKPNFLAFVATLDLTPEQTSQVIEAGKFREDNPEDSLAGFNAVSAMREKLLAIRPDLGDAVRNYYAGRQPAGDFRSR